MRKVAFTITQSYVVFRDVSDEDFRALCDARGNVLSASDFGMSGDAYFELLDARASDDAITSPGFVQIRASNTAEIVEALSNAISAVEDAEITNVIGNGLVAENGGVYPL